MNWWATGQFLNARVASQGSVLDWSHFPCFACHIATLPHWHRTLFQKVCCIHHSNYEKQYFRKWAQSHRTITQSTEIAHKNHQNINNILLWLIFELELLLPSGAKMAKWPKSQNFHCLLSPRRLKLASTLETQIWVNSQNFKRRIKLEIIIFPCGKVLPDFEMKDVLRKVIFRQDVERRINGHSLRERHRLFSFQHKKSLSQKKPIFVLSCFRFPPIFVTNPPWSVSEGWWSGMGSPVAGFLTAPKYGEFQFWMSGSLCSSSPTRTSLMCAVGRNQTPVSKWFLCCRCITCLNSIACLTSHLGRRSIIIITSGSRKWYLACQPSSLITFLLVSKTGLINPASVIYLS